ncbi:MAG: hypothetical protein LBU14_02630 [Candidatus Peribacteria bacterium]|jgi:hypothetical protein|nr:hypothetical protein [Candidatus Peribacteria bacterium]
MIRNLQENDLRICTNILEKEYSKEPYNETFESDSALKYIESKFKNNKETCFVLVENNKII